MSSKNKPQTRPTGIIRRIDDLGRIVIPREIRHRLRIRENDLLEMFVQDNAVVLMKYSVQKPVKEALDILREVVEEEQELSCGSALLKKIKEMNAILACECDCTERRL